MRNSSRKTVFVHVSSLVLAIALQPALITAAADPRTQNCFSYKPTLSLLVYMFDLESDIVTIYFLFAASHSHVNVP